MLPDIFAEDEKPILPEYACDSENGCYDTNTNHEYDESEMFNCVNVNGKITCTKFANPTEATQHYSTPIHNMVYYAPPVQQQPVAQPMQQVPVHSHYQLTLPQIYQNAIPTVRTVPYSPGCINCGN